MEKEKGRITTGGAGGFLNPPGDPEHGLSVETDLRRRPENRGSMSLRYAAECEWLDDSTRKEARAILDRFEPPALESEEIQDWISQMLGYYRSCYRNAAAGEREWHAGEMIIDAERDPLEHADEHAGVHHIRKWYPDFMPTRDHFEGAYWGTRASA